MPKFITEPGYDTLTPEQKSKICNGAGAAGDWRNAFIPNTLWGLDCTEVFNIHDYAYFRGVSLEDKHRADYALLINLLILIDDSKFCVLRWLRRLRAIDYYTAVVEFGTKPFFAGKSQ